MKKIVSVLLTIILVFCSTTGTFAASINNGQALMPQKITISEYQMIVNQEKVIEKELEKLMIEKSNGNNILGYDKKLEDLYKKKDTIKEEYKKLDEHIKSLKNRSKEDLEKFRYTPEQIEAIQNYDGSEKMMSAASATIGIYATNNDFYRDTTNNYTYLQLYYQWNWNGIPINGYTDCITAVWTNGYVNYTNHHAVDYYNSVTGDFSHYSNFYNVNQNSPDRLDYKFPVLTDTGTAVYFARQGTGYISLKRLDYNNQYNDISFKIAYGHEIYSLNLTAGFNVVSGTIGINIVPKSGTEPAYTNPEWYYWTRSL